MLRLFPNHAPQSYCWIDPDTNYQYREKTKEALITRILNYRRQNQLPRIEALDLVLENYWCSLPENYGKCQPLTLKRGWIVNLKGGLTLITKLLFDKFASREEAERRAAICLRCPHNSFPDKTYFQYWADDVASHCTDGRKVEAHDRLGSCLLCSCNLRAKVWFSGDMGVDPKLVPDYTKVGCWQLTADPTANKKE